MGSAPELQRAKRLILFSSDEGKKGEKPFIASVRLKVDELDGLAKGRK